MAVKIIIQRTIIEEQVEKAFPLFMKLREMAMKEDGYISGETLRNFEDPQDYIVISTWRSVEDWKAWEKSPVRKEIQREIETILREKTRYGIYQYL